MSKKEEYLLEFKSNMEKMISQAAELQNAVQSIFDTMERSNSVSNFQRQTLQATRRAESQFNSLRNVVHQVFNSIRSVGNAMQSLSQIGIGRFVSTFESTLVSRFTGLFTSQLDSAVERFDIMKTFPATMANFGVSANAAGEAIKKMNEAVIGLPTSLSEIVELSQRFVSVMPAMGLQGDELMSKASDFAIAINNAFLAGGNTAQQAYFAMMQMQDLFTKGELTDREWKSLSTGLQGAGIKIAEYFDYKNFLELADAIDAGDVSLQQFVDGIIELGTSGGTLDKMARIYTQRLSSVFTNIGNAFQRLIAGNMVEGVDEEGNPIYKFSGGILGTLDSLIAERFADNESINDLASYIRQMVVPKIDELGEQLSGWIIEHQDEVFDFFDRLLNYDWAGLTGKIADFLALKWDVLINLLEKIPPGLMAFASTLAGPAGKALTTFANLIEPIVLTGMWLGKGKFVVATAGKILGAGSDIATATSATSASVSLPGAAGAGATTGGIGVGAATLGTVGALTVIGAAGYAAYKEWNGATEAAETYYYTIDKLERDNALTPENLAKLRDDTTKQLDSVRNEYDAYLADYRARYELYTSQGGTQSFDEWLPFWVRWKSSDYETAISEYERSLTRIDNLNLMHSESWKTYKAEADKIGGIPDDLIKSFEDGAVEIPDTLDEFLALISTWTGDVETEVETGFRGAMTKGKKQVDQGIQDVENSMDTFVNDFSIYGERLSGQGFFLGDSFGRSLYNSIVSWLNEIFPLLDLTYTKIGNAQTKASGNKSGTPGEMSKQFSAYGGSVYFGKSTKGNYHDTIPAMLSPGEYVLTKKAVDRVGLDFLNKINNFNFAGALNSLSQRVGAGMRPYAFAGVPSNDTRIYNNNAQANITVNNSSQEFTQRRANKWIRGLN